jgi:hypothetical protein
MVRNAETKAAARREAADKQMLELRDREEAAYPNIREAREADLRAFAARQTQEEAAQHLHWRDEAERKLDVAAVWPAILALADGGNEEAPLYLGAMWQVAVWRNAGSDDAKCDWADVAEADAECRRWRAAADLADGGRARRLAAKKDHDAADAVADQLTSGIIASWDVNRCAMALHRGAKGALLGVGAGRPSNWRWRKGSELVPDDRHEKLIVHRGRASTTALAKMIGVDVSGVVPGCLNAAYHRSLRAEPVLPVLLARPVRNRRTELVMPSAAKCAEWAAVCRRVTDAVDAVVDIAADQIRSGHYKNDADEDLQLAPVMAALSVARAVGSPAAALEFTDHLARLLDLYDDAPNPWAFESIMGSKMAEVVKMAGGEQAR